jgi:ornithine carbamoyltransferase
VSASPEHFLSLADWPAGELIRMLDRALELKRLDRQGERPQTLQGRTLAMYFEKPSLRTHVTFEAGMTQLGGHAILLRPEQVGIGTRETAEEMAEAASIPIINGLTDLLHPCQVMADLLTIRERADLKSCSLAYLGDGNNMAHSLLLAAAVLGLELRLATPASHQPEPSIRRRAEALAQGTGARLSWSEDPVEAVRGAHFVYTDVWASMGQEAEAEARRRIFRPYQLNAELLSHARDAWILHCLPAHRGEEVTDEVIDGPRSIVFDQAENRLHAQKAILERLLSPNRG